MRNVVLLLLRDRERAEKERLEEKKRLERQQLEEMKRYEEEQKKEEEWRRNYNSLVSCLPLHSEKKLMASMTHF